MDWQAVREEWEATDVSDAALAARWGLKSGTSIRKARHRDGWTRDAEANRARMALTGEVLPPKPSPEVRTARAPAHQSAHQQRAPAHLSAENPMNTEGVRPVVRDTSEFQPPAEILHVGELLPPGPGEDVLSARRDQAQRQLKRARKMIDMAMRFIEHLNAIADHDLDDPDALTLARSALQAINPDKDSISTLLKSFALMLETGHKLERQALGMVDPDKIARAATDQLATAQAAAAGTQAALTSTLEGLSDEALAEIRQMSIKATREK